MRTFEITHTAAHLLHTLDDLSTAVDCTEQTRAPLRSDPRIYESMADFRLALVTHAALVSKLLDETRHVLGDGAEVEAVAMLVEELFERTRELRVALRDKEPLHVQLGLVFVATIADELLDAERRLLSTTGTLLFPAETW